ncbi:unnamed protein product [Closterium sp. NIES-54]
MASAKAGDGAGDLDLSRANQGVWLMKVPQFVAERWHKAGDKPGGEAAAGGGAGQGTLPTPPPPGGGAGAGGVGVVGRVRMAFDPRARPQGGQAATQFMMRLEVPEGAAAELPMEYNLAFTPDHVPMHVFSESASGEFSASLVHPNPSCPCESTKPINPRVEYNLAFTPDHVPMHVFSESASGELLCVAVHDHSTTTPLCEVQPRLHPPDHVHGHVFSESASAGGRRVAGRRAAGRQAAGRRVGGADLGGAGHGWSATN